VTPLSWKTKLARQRRSNPSEREVKSFGTIPGNPISHHGGSLYPSSLKEKRGKVCRRSWNVADVRGEVSRDQPDSQEKKGAACAKKGKENPSLTEKKSGQTGGGVYLFYIGRKKMCVWMQ